MAHRLHTLYDIMKRTRKGRRKSHKWQPSTGNWECAARVLGWPLSNEVSHRKGCRSLPKTRHSNRSSLPELLGRKTQLCYAACISRRGSSRGHAVRGSTRGKKYRRRVGLIVGLYRVQLSEWCRRGKAHAYVCVSESHVLKKRTASLRERDQRFANRA